MQPEVKINRGENIMLMVKPDLLALFIPPISTAVLFAIMFFMSLRFSLMFSLLILMISVSVTAIFSVYTYLNYLYTFYAVTDRRVVFQSGIIGRDYREFKFEKIQNIYVGVGVFERLIGVGNIMFSTAGESGVEITFRLVRNPLSVKQGIGEVIDKHQKTAVDGV